MAKVVLKRGTSDNLDTVTLQDGQVLVTLDDGRAHVDYLDEENNLVRKTLYGGKLVFGKHIYDGTSDVEVEIYDGAIK